MEMAQTTGAPTTAAQRRLALKFFGSGSEYFRIWIVNLLLTLVTLTLYYPFAKVRRLRYFYAATEVGGQPLSFHADPWKMLRGYLLVGLMLVLYGVAGQVSPTAGLVAFVIVALVWPALWHSSLRFRLANSGWRGLRFRFTGTRGGAYAALAPGFVVAAVLVGLSATMDVRPGAPDPGFTPTVMALALLPLVFMLMAPWLLWLLRRYQHRHYALASEQTQFGVPLRSFYGLALRVFGLGLLVSLVGGVMVAVLFPVFRALAGGGDPTRALSFIALLPLLVMLVLLVVFQLALRPYVTSRSQNLVWNGTHSEHISFDSQLRFWPLLRLTLKNWFFMVITLGLYFPFAAVATAKMRLEAVQVLTRGDPDELLATLATHEEAAAGDAAGDLLGMDIGL